MAIDLSKLGPARSIDDLLQFSKFFLFGASAGAVEVEDFLLSRNKSIVGYLDNSPAKHGSLFRGRMVIDPTTLFDHIDGQTAIIISSAYQVEIAEQLINTLDIDPSQVFPFVSEMFHKHFGAAAVGEHLEAINRLKEMVADQESRDYIDNLIRFRWTMDPRELKRNPCLTGFYDYRPIHAQPGSDVGPFKGDRIIDCGAFNGDTAKAFLERLDNDCEIIAIEPVTANYDALSQWVDTSGLETRVTPLKLGVGETRATMTIEIAADAEDPRATLANTKNSAQSEEVAIESIDSIVNGGPNKIDYVKIDIEGFEPEALRGAAGVLNRDRPDLAIAGYHKCEHLWELPQLITQIEPSYKIFVGHHPAAPYECEFFCTAR